MANHELFHRLKADFKYLQSQEWSWKQKPFVPVMTVLTWLYIIEEWARIGVLQKLKPDYHSWLDNLEEFEK